MPAQTAAQKIAALEANVNEMGNGIAAILAAMQSNATPAPKKAPTSRKSANATAQAKVAKTAARAAAAGTHNVLRPGATHPAHEEEIGGIAFRFMPRNVNGVRVAPLNVGGKSTAKSLNRAMIECIIEYGDDILAVLDSIESDAGIGAHAPVVADEEGE